MGQAQSNKQTFHQLDSRSKIGRHASTRTSLLTANERRELIERSLKLQPNYRRESSITRSSSRLPEWVMKKDLKGGDLSNLPPLAGTLHGTDWNKYVEDLWSKDDRTVIHSIILPEGRDARDVRFRKSRIVNQKDYKLPKGVIPETVWKSSPLFESIVEADKRPASLPPHFLVTDAQVPAETSFDKIVTGK